MADSAGQTLNTNNQQTKQEIHMADILPNVSLSARSRTQLDDAKYNDIRKTALSNPGTPVVVNTKPGATDTSDREQRKELSAVANKLRKEGQNLEAPFDVATAVKLIDGTAYALVQVDPKPEQE